MIGTRINNYEIVSLIGEGGMGNVYLARHPLIDRGAAIKVLHSELAGDRTLVTRFFNEARAANAIRHPNIIDIIDVGLLPGTERPYLMMELLEGENLAKRISRLGRMPLGQVLDVARQTASALAAAHTKGIIHRDLKPENLFLVPHGSLPGREVVKVLDFGIAKLRSKLGDARVQTQTGLLMGTPPYMSPEQCRGVTDEIDLRTDVYALGIILFEMTCGSPPFSAAGFGELLVMHILHPPPSPRSRNPDVPEALEAIILKALAKSAADRFPNMTDFEIALAAVPPAGASRAATLEGIGPGAAARAAASGSPPAAAARAEAPTSEGGRHAAARAVEAPTAPAAGTAGASGTHGPTTTFRTAAGEMSAELEAMGLVRSRRPLVLGGLAVLGLGLVLFVALGSREKSGAPSATGAPEASVAMPAPTAAPPSPPPAAREKARPPAHAAATQPHHPDAGVGTTPARPTTSRSVSRPASSKPPAPRPPSRSGPEKW